MPALPKRKKHHLSGDLYRLPGAYFITICTADRKKLFWDGSFGNEADGFSLTHEGMVAQRHMNDIAMHYKNNVCVKKYVVMPNHVHMLITVQSSEDYSCPDMRQVIRQYKAAVSHELGYSVWQKGYYDRIVRDEAEYLEIWKYIDENPIKWNLDQYYDS